MNIDIYAVEDKDGIVIGIEYDKDSDIIKLPPLAVGWHYEIERSDTK